MVLDVENTMGIIRLVECILRRCPRLVHKISLGPLIGIKRKGL